MDVTKGLQYKQTPTNDEEWVEIINSTNETVWFEETADMMDFYFRAINPDEGADLDDFTCWADENLHVQAKDCYA